MKIKRKFDIAVSISGDNFFPFNWFQYNSPTGTHLTDAYGKTVILQRGDIFGIKEFSRKTDILFIVKHSQLKLRIPIALSERTMRRSIPYKVRPDPEEEVVKPRAPKGSTATRISITTRSPETHVVPKLKRKRMLLKSQVETSVLPPKLKVRPETDQPHPVTENPYRRTPILDDDEEQVELDLEVIDSGHILSTSASNNGIPMRPTKIRISKVNK